MAKCQHFLVTGANSYGNNLRKCASNNPLNRDRKTESEETHYISVVSSAYFLLTVCLLLLLFGPIVILILMSQFILTGD